MLRQTEVNSARRELVSHKARYLSWRFFFRESRQFIMRSERAPAKWNIFLFVGDNYATDQKNGASICSLCGVASRHPQSSPWPFAVLDHRATTGIALSIRCDGTLASNWPARFSRWLSRKISIKYLFNGGYRGGMARERIYVFGHPFSKLDAVGAGDRAARLAVAVAKEHSPQLS
jgi:hypothetical protein